MGTVYMGEQVLPTLFFMLGWAQAALQPSAGLAQQPVTATTQAPAKAPFRSVIA
jgi:hypothetical protein